MIWDMLGSVMLRMFVLVWDNLRIEMFFPVGEMLVVKTLPKWVIYV